MTLEEIINIDWAEQTDLSEYVKHFEDAQLLNAQLAEFTYRYLRTKLIRWDEIVEEYKTLTSSISQYHVFE